MTIDLLHLVARSLRAGAVVVGLCIAMLASEACPTGEIGCDMVGMEDLQTDDPVCVLACGVPFPDNVATMQIFLGEVSILVQPPTLSFTGILIEPDVPPPRFAV